MNVHTRPSTRTRRLTISAGVLAIAVAMSLLIGGCGSTSGNRVCVKASTGKATSSRNCTKHKRGYIWKTVYVKATPKKPKKGAPKKSKK
jgi:hypothetical protein